jgi:phage tail-like protein
MKLVDFGATADLVGRRIRIAWDFVPEGTETVADAPAVKIKRKLRDFDFPTPDAPFVIYDSASFPPAPSPTLTVTDLPGWEVQNGAMRTSYSAISIATAVGSGRFLEVMRRTVGTRFDAMGVAVQQHVEILDLGGAPGALVPGRVYYYEIHGPSVPAVDDPATYRTACAPTETFGINRTLYDMLPEVYKRHDVATRPDNLVPDSVPEAARRAGQLRRFVDLFGIASDSLRGTAESLRNLHDVDEVDAKYLPWLARWIGWDLSFNAGVPLQRNEVKGASRLYRTVGTVPGLRAIVSQYTGWFTQVAEFVQHIARANDAPTYNLFASVERGTAWRGTDDASAALGFGPGNTDAAGSGLVAASLTSAIAHRMRCARASR